MPANRLDDTQLTDLALAARAGDRAALSDFLSAVHGDVKRFVAHMAGPGDAEDLTQDTVMRAMKALPGFEARSSARTWILSIARHTVMDHFRSVSRRPRLATVPDWAVAVDAATAESRPQHDEYLALAQLIGRLEPQRREAFIATQVLGLSYGEAAQMCDCPIGTIRSRVARAREDLAAALAAAEPPAERGRHLRAL